MTETETRARKVASLDDLVHQGEDALHRLAELPGGQRALKLANDLRQRVDDLSRRVRGIDALENRVAELEREVAELRAAQKPAAKPRQRKTA
jgi:polyhydroxyalkanoate synthesis regulator phasin